MEHVAKPTKVPYKTESSIFHAPIRNVTKDQAMLPTWALLVILIVAFFILKSFIYISDKKRHGQ